MTTPLPPGTWPSPLTAADVAAGGVRYGSTAVTDGGARVWWSESRPAERGRTTVLRRTAEGPVTEVLPASLDARTRVHEYGGRCWLALDDRLVTSNLADQRLYLVDGDDVRPITDETGCDDRYADPVPLPGGTHICCVRERIDGRTTHALVAVPLDGSGEVVELWSGSDFVAGAAVSPGGERLAFVTWDHPDMPWDASRLRVAPLLPGPALGEAASVLGGPGESVLAPSWDGDDAVRAATDRSGWWNLVRVPVAGGPPEPLHPVAEDCGYPFWQVGFRDHVPVARGRVAQLCSGRLTGLGPEGPDPLGLPLTGWMPWLDADDDVVAGVAWTGVRRPAVVAVDMSRCRWREVAGPEQPDPAWAPVPRRLTFPSAGGREVHAVLYPPTSPVAGLPDGVAPPAVVFVHGGPTAAAVMQYSPQVAFFTSRGLAVVDVDHGGSTGYGRAFREVLRGQWGVVDVEDCEAVARALVDEGLASGVAIRGGSAGGWTVLSALTRGDSPFDAGVSYYGVADAAALARDTHDFESRYLDGLIGPLPEAQPLYDARSPLTHAHRLDRPVLLLQGEDDPVVPPLQAETFLAALAGRGVLHAYLSFPGEAHGFRRAETVAAALEAELSFYGQVWGFDPPGVPVLPLQR